MCLILFAYKIHPEYKLILAANRDEFYQRPTREAHWWSGNSTFLAGKDLKGKGSWMGINKLGKWAALTNYREVGQELENAPTRGTLVTDYRRQTIEGASYIRQVKNAGSRYNGFNLLVGDEDQIWHYSNRAKRPQRLTPGIYGLSNHLLNTPWPKVMTGKEGLRNWIDGKNKSFEELFSLLQMDRIAPDDQLPHTGVSLEWERRLSAMFIKSPEYGTRVSTIMTINQKNSITAERRK